GGYRIEYAASGRAKCKGPKPCMGTQIEKGAMRLGSLVDIGGHTNFSWKHWGCVTARVLTNIKKSIGEAAELDGYEDLRPGDQAKLDVAWEEGHVADADIPDTARKPEKDGDDD
ncbi:zf-PARP-domain-containing protein, partial [Auricularia subglabra TFB-10046 SS5]